MRYLTKTVETYRLPNEESVEQFLKELKEDSHFTIAKYTSTKKEIKEKGEVVEEYIRFEVTKLFNNEKEPDSYIDIKYSVE